MDEVWKLSDACSPKASQGRIFLARVGEGARGRLGAWEVYQNILEGLPWPVQWFKNLPASAESTGSISGLGRFHMPGSN